MDWVYDPTKLTKEYIMKYMGLRDAHIDKDIPDDQAVEHVLWLKEQILKNSRGMR